MATAKRPPDPLAERISQLGEPPRPRLGLGKVPIPPKEPEPAEAVDSSPESTYVGVAPPPVGQWQEKRSFTPPPMASRAERKAIAREAKSEGASVVEPPESTTGAYAVVPQGRREDFKADSRGIHVTWGTVRTVLWWTAPIVLSVLGTVTGYFEGLKKAGERVAAIEERARLNAETDKRQDVRLDAHDANLDRAFVILRDNDARLPKLKTEIEEVRGAQPRIEGLPKKGNP